MRFGISDSYEPPWLTQSQQAANQPTVGVPPALAPVAPPTTDQGYTADWDQPYSGSMVGTVPYYLASSTPDGSAPTPDGTFSPPSTLSSALPWIVCGVVVAGLWYWSK